ncbi:Insulin-degrading enzyme, partial [Exaiptasia diaphana]
PLAYVDPAHCNLSSIFVKLLKDELNEFAYDAEIAGISYSIDNTMYGMSVSIFCRERFVQHDVTPANPFLCHSGNLNSEML